MKYLSEPMNITLIPNNSYEDIIFLPDVIAIDEDEEHYRFYLSEFNPSISNNIFLERKPDGTIGIPTLPYTFKKKQICFPDRYIIMNE